MAESGAAAGSRPGSLPEPPSDSIHRIAAAMRDPAFYPEHPIEVELIETHGSWVYRAGRRVYKLKKPVVFPFLDYGTAQRRRRMCEEEVRLGRRLAPDIYLGVRAVVQRGEGYALADDGRGVEHVVEMRRFEDDRTLAAVVARGEATPELLGQVARRIAAFHASAEHAPAAAFGPSQVAATVSENFATLLPHATELGPVRLAAAHRFAAAFLHGGRALLSGRAAGGHVRDCHGDLRAEHVILEHGVEVFDPVEFDPGLRRIDVAADLAFLAMELFAAGREDLAQLLVQEYRAAGGDDGGDTLLWFYAAYRAWVRVKVACARAGELSPGDERERSLEQARALAAAAGRLAWRARRPVVLVICGGSASGKTHLAQALQGPSGLDHLSSDLVRKELAGLRPEQRAAAGEYSEEASVRTYAELGRRAATAASGGGVLVDATFRRRSHRDAFAGGYGDAESPVFVQCRAPARVLRERARRRERDPERVSDAGPELAERQRLEFEPLDEVAPDRHLALRTDRPVENAIDELEAELDARLARSGIP